MECSEALTEGSSLLELLPLLQKLVFSGISRKSFHYSKSQLTVIMILSVRDTMTMKEIAGYLASSKEQATRCVAPLVDAGLVERFTLPSNRVHVYVRLTEAGHLHLQELRNSVCENLQARLTEGLSPAEQQALSDSLGTVITLLQKIC